MASPIFACGAECGVIASTGPHFNVFGGVVGFNTATFRTGLRSIRFNPTANQGYMESIVLPSTTDWVIRAYIRFTSLPSATVKIIGLTTAATGAGAYFNASDSKLYAGSDTSTFGASGVSVTTGVWYRLDIGTTSTTVDLQVDGTAAGQLSGSFSVTTKFTIGVVSSTTCDLYFDDILVSQTIADYPLGAGFVKSYIPNADGTHNVTGANDFERTLTGTDITNATTDAYTLINKRPLPSSAVDFINGIAPPNSTDYVEWQYEDSTEADPPRYVDAAIAIHDANTAGANAMTVTLREDVGGTSADIFSGDTNGGLISYRRAGFATVPGTSDAWTTDKFNALRSRFLVSDAAPDPYVDAALLEAEFPEPVSEDRVPRFSPYPQILAQ